MPVPRIKIVFHADLEAKLDALKTAVESDMPAAGRIQDKPFNWTRERMLDGWATTLDVRIKTKADADALWTKLQNKAAVYAGQAKGKIAYHLCSHNDAGVASCTDTGFQEIKLGTGF